MQLNHLSKLLGAATFGLALGLSFFACGSDTEPEGTGTPGGCKLPFIGDPNAEMELIVTALRPGPSVTTLSEGSSATLMFPPQGGRVLFAGVRARNVDPCAVRLAGALRDPLSQQVRIETRIVNLKVSEDGYGESDPMDTSSFANIPVCPNQWSSQDIFDNPHELTITLTDRDNRKATKVMTIIPRCDEEGLEADCRCICDVDYVLGAACDDGGLVETPDGSAPDASSEGGL